MRLRVLRLCLDQELTNKQLAERLGKDPGTLLHHVRILVKAGFLAPGETRHGSHGALEKPYRATGKSWTLDFSAPEDEESSVSRASLEAFRAELAESGPGAMASQTRLGLSLTGDSLDELKARLMAVLEEFVERSPEHGGVPYGLYLAIHRHRRAGRGRGGGAGGSGTRRR
jgi:hypothetical protein